MREFPFDRPYQARKAKVRKASGGDGKKGIADANQENRLINSNGLLPRRSSRDTAAGARGKFPKLSARPSATDCRLIA